MKFEAKVEVKLRTYVFYEGENEEEALDQLEKQVKDIYGSKLVDYDIRIKQLEEK